MGDPGVVVTPNASHNMLSKGGPGVVVTPNASHNMLSMGNSWCGGYTQCLSQYAVQGGSWCGGYTQCFSQYAGRDPVITVMSNACQNWTELGRLQAYKTPSGENSHTWEYWGCTAGHGAFFGLQTLEQGVILIFQNWQRVLF